MADDFENVNPAEFYRTFLEQDTRPDGRDLSEFRQTTLNIGSISTADGSALARIGNTSVMCGIKAEIATPKPDKPTLGFVVPNVELPALCSPLFKSGPPSELAQTSSVFINDLLIASKVIRLEDLCIIEGKVNGSQSMHAKPSYLKSPALLTLPATSVSVYLGWFLNGISAQKAISAIKCDK